MIIDELGTGLTARGSDLNAVIHRANPALGDTDRVLQILARQNHQLAQLATDSDTVLQPLARERHQLAGFITQANTTSVASAQRAADISQTFKLFPSFLRRLRPLMADLGSLADQGTPLMQSLGQSATARRTAVRQPDPVRRQGAHGADRARRLGPEITAGAGGHDAAGPPAAPAGRGGRARGSAAGPAHGQPEQHRRRSSS